MNKTSIEWTDYTWNPIRARRILAGVECDCPCDLCGPGQIHCGKAPCDAGRSGTFCTRISPGCANCYASVINKRFGNGLEYTVPNLEHVEFFIDEKILAEPLKRKKPARIFVGDMFDLFHEAIPQELIAEVLRVAWKLPRHTFQILTKRAERMQRMVAGMYGKWGDPGEQPRDNIWLGVSVESQKYADERIPLLLQTPAAVRFLSVEPQLEAVNLVSIDGGGGYFFNCLTDRVPFGHYEYKTGIDWVICGGESGPGARPMHPGWPRSLRDQCAAANIPFFFKQWGEWQPHQYPPDPNADYHGGLFLLPNGQLGNQGDWWSGRAHAMDRVGKKNAGALLDGREWREFPQPSQKEAVSA